MNTQIDRNHTEQRPGNARRTADGIRSRRYHRSAERGAIAILFAILIVVLIGFCGLALDLSFIFNRKVELQTVADAAALAAARQLDGTPEGIKRAVDKAAAAAEALKYNHDKTSIVWAPGALKFSSSASSVESDWVDATAASTSPRALTFAKVETTALSSAGLLRNVFMGAVSSLYRTTRIAGRAVAGPTTVNVTPLAVCALSNTPFTKRQNPGPPQKDELVEYGFRRGVGYDLMRLAPDTDTPANFLVDPISPAGALPATTNTDKDFVAPFICAGRMRARPLANSTVTVSRDFPIGTLWKHLNTRFGEQYSSTGCTPLTAPPDSNVKPYAYTGIPWMVSTPAGTGPGQQTALSLKIPGQKLWTVADPSPAPDTNTSSRYGPLWSFAKAVPWSSYVQDEPEPAAGYTTFAPSEWSTLYKPGSPSANKAPAPNSYPATSPYIDSTSLPGTAYRPGKQYRRVLNVPLLRCPVAAGSASTADVLAIARFFMTVQATDTALSAEFAGLAQEASLTAEVELIQ